ncbi:MAG: fumarylacetoacetate hydrolase family protein [Ilumatobacteraceae bacterium]
MRHRTDGVTACSLQLDDGLAPLPVDSVSAWLRADAATRADLLEKARRGARRGSGGELLAPVDGRMEVWACGVTYRRSLDARVEESTDRDVYDRVYDAHRPEVFFKAAAWRVVGPDGAVTLRRDAKSTVPEPELAAVVAADGSIAGYTICNDVSSRDIEGENPLYLPQAKVWRGSCAVGPGIVPVTELSDPAALAITMRILRRGEVVFAGEASTGDLKRSVAELVDAVIAEDDFPDGLVVSTGTCIVPPLEFSLLPGDRIDIEIDGIGTLSNTVALNTAGGRSAPRR